ncbi:MAG: hypothetical protein AB2660_09980 [Candidatus Thiodiazotropha sp.]
MELIGIIISICLCYFAGKYVGLFIRKACNDSFELVPPKDVDKDEWESLVSPKGGENAGKYLGFLERVLSFIAFYQAAYVLIGGWLAFKVASKWQVWSNVISVPKTLENVSEISYLRARRLWGGNILMRFLLGPVNTNFVKIIG